MNYTMRTEGDLQDKLLSYVCIDENGCWMWQRAKIWQGYGHFSWKGKQSSTHRLSYEAFIGSIPEGSMVCHSCDVRLCINPDHLWLGTCAENMKDASLKGRLVQSDETKQKRSRALRGRTKAEETKKKISEAHKGKKHSDETKRKMSESAKRRWSLPTTTSNQPT